jgi:hypothetical protein
MSAFDSYAPWVPDNVVVGDISYTPLEFAQQHSRPLGIDPPDAPPAALTPAVNSSGSSIPHVANWEEKTKTVFIQAFDHPLSQVSLSDLVGQFRADGHPQIDFVKVEIAHRGILTAQNVMVLDRIGFTRDEIGKFVFTFSYADNKRRKQDFTPVQPLPVEPEWDAYQAELNSIRERQAFCNRNNIRFLQDEIDRAKWLEAKIAEEKAWRESPEQKALDAQIKAIGEQLAELQKGKS